MNRIFIVANGEKAMRVKKKDLIDSSIVVRMNRFHIDGYEDYIGTRTDIYSCGMKYLDFIDSPVEKRIEECEKEFYEKLSKSNIKLNEQQDAEYREEYIKCYMIPKIESLKIKEILYLLAPDGAIIPDYPFKDKIRTKDFEMELCYSTGIRTIIYILKHYPNHEVYVTGFNNFLSSGLSSGWYWNTKKIDKVIPPYVNFINPLMKEREKIRDLIKENRIVEI